MPTFQQHDIHELHAGPSLVRVAPQFGGRLLSWHVDGEPIIFWPETADWTNLARVRGGNPLLFPFLGRHRVDGELGRWRDAAGVVRDLPMHGFARDLPFAAHASPDGAALAMSLDATDALHDSYPFDFRFEASYRLVDAHTLDVALTTTNRGATPLPYYAGHHFYFALPHGERAQTTLELPPTQRRMQLANGSISAAEPGQSSYSLGDPEILDRFHCLDDGAPSAPVRIVMPGRGRTIEIALDIRGSIPWYAVTTWTEKPESDFYCVEPWLGLPDAIHNGLGLRMLAPGATETATLRIRVLPHAG
ncbi:aldose epimerase [Burkholderia vietnamiensis]|uniref:aldose epimerase family protein n=1 Tax=Burkholderia vietnamiensis TaxID=60552 RepID=UPI00075DF0B6|nr:aldose epimerase [Burkholderia vietnamiensis]KVG05517.1 aldose epimerase [Burkholderia vietnamiensis]